MNYLKSTWLNKCKINSLIAYLGYVKRRKRSKAIPANGHVFFVKIASGATTNKSDKYN